MADDNLYSLLIKVEGGDAAAAEIIKSQYALKSVEDESDALKTRFQEGFQHVALKGFIADAGRSIGLGGELRPIISLLNVGVTELGESFGFLGTNMALATAGLTALAGLAVVAYNHFQKHNETLDDTIRKEQDALKSTTDLHDELKGYADTIGGLPPELAALAAATDKLGDAQKRLLALDLQKRLNDLNDELAKAKAAFDPAINSAAAQAATLDRFAKGSKEAAAATGEVTHVLTEQEVATAAIQLRITQITEVLDRFKKTGDLSPVTDSIKNLDKAAQDSQKFMDDLSDSIGKDADRELAASEKVRQQKLKEYEQVQNGLVKLHEMATVLRDQELQATMDAEAKKKAAIDQFRDQHMASIQAEYARLIEAAHGNAYEIIKIEKAKKEAIDQLGSTVVAKQKQDYSQIQLVAGQAYDSISAGVSQAAARSIVESKNAHDEIIQLTKNVEEQVVASLIRIAVQAVITKEAVMAVFAVA